MLGAFLASGITTLSELSLNMGILPALLGGFLYAVYLYLKRTQKKDYTPLQALFNTFLFATPITLLLGLTITAFTEKPAPHKLHYTRQLLTFTPNILCHLQHSTTLRTPKLRQNRRGLTYN